MLIQAKSYGFDAGNKAEILINNKKVEMEKNCNSHLRGLHVVVIDPFSGAVKFAKVFDTYKDSMDLEYFITSEYIPNDFIVVAAC